MVHLTPLPGAMCSGYGGMGWVGTGGPPCLTATSLQSLGVDNVFRSFKKTAGGVEGGFELNGACGLGSK